MSVKAVQALQNEQLEAVALALVSCYPTRKTWIRFSRRFKLKNHISLWRLTVADRA